jgi:hypothetical protein
MALAGVGCSDDDQPVGAPEPADLADCPNRPRGSSSPATFDPSSGTYAAQSLSVVADRRVRFDVVQILSGAEADEAYARETGDRPGVPNDYLIVNERAQLRVAPVRDDASVLALRADGYAGTLHAVPLRDLPTDSADRTFWLTFDDGSITEICHQYRP